MEGNDAGDKITALCQSIKHNQTWVPNIMLTSTHFSQHLLTETDTYEIHTMPGNLQQHEVNLPLFLDVSKADTPSLSIYRSHVLGYPPNAVLELQSFQDLDAQNDLINSLKEAAAAGGTVLVIDSISKCQR